jgi:hypothetical protein
MASNKLITVYGYKHITSAQKEHLATLSSPTYTSRRPPQSLQLPPHQILVVAVQGLPQRDIERQRASNGSIEAEEGLADMFLCTGRLIAAFLRSKVCFCAARTVVCPMRG